VNQHLLADPVTNSPYLPIPDVRKISVSVRTIQLGEPRKRRKLRMASSNLVRAGRPAAVAGGALFTTVFVLTKMSFAPQDKR
jgi:hypothetical protein